MSTIESQYLKRKSQESLYGNQLLTDYYRTNSYQHRVIGGHDIVLKIGDTPIGRAQAISATRDFGIEPVYELGSMKPREFIPMRYNGSLTLERYLIRENDLVSILRDVKTTYATADGMKETNAASSFSLSDEGKILLHSISGISISVIDRYASQTDVTKRVLREYRNCVFASYDEDFRAGALSGERATVFYTEVWTPGDDEAATATSYPYAGGVVGT